MRNENCNVGGEQSGHIILTDYVTTGDGLIAALQILSLLKNSNKKLVRFPMFLNQYLRLLKI